MRTIQVKKWNDETVDMNLSEYQDQYLGMLGHVQRLAEHADIRNSDKHYYTDTFNNAIDSLTTIVSLEFDTIYHIQNS